MHDVSCKALPWFIAGRERARMPVSPAVSYHPARPSQAAFVSQLAFSVLPVFRSLWGRLEYPHPIGSLQWGGAM